MTLSPQTRLIHEGMTRSQFGETSEAIYLTSGFVYDTAEQAEARFRGDADEQGKYIYSRYGNPSVSLFEERLRLVEGAEVCVATGSGMSAMAASLLCHLKAGDHVVASNVLFGSCMQVLQTYLPRYGIETTLVDGDDLQAWAEAIRPGQTKALFCETPANPTLALVDIAAVSELAHQAGAWMIVDNAFASPVVQKPYSLGADIVTYSATKHLDGQGRCMGGAILCSQAFYDEHLEHYIRHLGPASARTMHGHWPRVWKLLTCVFVACAIMPCRWRRLLGRAVRWSAFYTLGLPITPSTRLPPAKCSTAAVYWLSR